jgi:NAD(P)-dependent dehydrogenase (short-subunit alcohol dehydrogenase family)
MFEMTGKTVIITGATSGLGLQSAKELAKMGASLVITGRNSEKLEQSISEIIKTNPNVQVDGFICDQSLLSNVRQLAKEISSKYPSINVLINNAAVSTQNPHITVEGLENAFVVNYLSHFLLTRLLLSKLTESQARIINVTSTDHFLVNFDCNDLECLKLYGFNRAYAKTKLYMIMHTYDLARNLENSGATINAVHPGRIKTGIGRNDSQFFHVAKDFLDTVASIDIEKGAWPQVWLASNPALKDINGRYYDGTRIAKSSRASYNQRDQEILRRMSIKMCGLNEV